jgi:5-carboxymethyl-2-hydroxymuconate isomerase
MPHIHLITTADIVENPDNVDILERLVAKLSGFETISSTSIKAYHSMKNTWVMGAGNKPGFIHCEVAILAGRPQDLKKKIAEEMYRELKACFPSSADSQEASFTLELREMDPETYQK